MNISFAANCQVDRAGIKGLLKPDCIICNVHLKDLERRVCPGCPFRFNSRAEGKRSRIYPGKEFSKYGLKNLPSMGKHTLFYFLYYPELNFNFPQHPQIDLLGNDAAVYNSTGRKLYGKKFLWHIHHLNGNYWDDSIWNLLLCLNTEHGLFESEVKKFRKIAESALWV